MNAKVPSRTPQSCTYRENPRPGEDGEVATCGLLREISGVDDEGLVEAHVKACEVCCKKAPPTAEHINSVIASPALRRRHRREGTRRRPRLRRREDGGSRDEGAAEPRGAQLPRRQFRTPHSLHIELLLPRGADGRTPVRKLPRPCPAESVPVRTPVAQRDAHPAVPTLPRLRPATRDWRRHSRDLGSGPDHRAARRTDLGRNSREP